MNQSWPTLVNSHFSSFLVPGVDDWYTNSELITSVQSFQVLFSYFAVQHQLVNWTFKHYMWLMRIPVNKERWNHRKNCYVKYWMKIRQPDISCFLVESQICMTYKRAGNSSHVAIASPSERQGMRATRSKTTGTCMVECDKRQVEVKQMQKLLKSTTDIRCIQTAPAPWCEHSDPGIWSTDKIQGK